MQAKANLRTAIKERLSHLNERARQAESRILCRHLDKYLGEKKRVITAYVPLSDEPDIRPLMNQWLDACWTLALPNMEHNTLVFRTVKSLDEAVSNPLTQLKQPPDTNPLIDRKRIDIVLVPGRAFAKDGKRLGRGNGGYDRWISDQRNINPLTKYIGVCFECQIVTAIPTEAHDESVGILLTASGLLIA